MNRIAVSCLGAAIFGLALSPAFAAKPDPDLQALSQRLQALQDPQVASFAPLQKMQAQQAVAAYAAARRNDKPASLYLAQRRLDIAETEIQLEQAQGQLAEQQRAYSQLQVLAAQRDAERARQETAQTRQQAEQQAQQHEAEMEQLRQQAEAEAQARAQAQAALTSVAGRQASKVEDARRKETQLARQEAELVSGVKVPASKFDDRGEVFALAGSQFQPGGATLSSAGQRTLKGVAAYLISSPRQQASVVGYGDVYESGVHRAEAVRTALVAAGVPAARIKLASKPLGNDTRMAEVVLSSP